MMSQFDEGAGVVANRFGAMFASGPKVDTQKREERERKATQTADQRARSQGKSKLINFKSTATFQTFLRNFAAQETINQSRKVTMTELIEKAVQEYAEKRGYKG